jgi:hypothetical protein
MSVRLTDTELVLVIDVKIESPSAGARTPWPTANGTWVVSSCPGLFSTANGWRSGSRGGCRSLPARGFGCLRPRRRSAARCRRDL